MMENKKVGARLHTTGKEAIEQRDVCSECFSWLEGGDRFCWGCGIEVEDMYYSREELEKEGK